MSEPTEVTEARSRMHEFLSSFKDVSHHDDGTASLQYGSARVVVSVEVFDEDQAVVKVRSQLVTGAKSSPELFHHVATQSTELGHLRAVEEEDGSVTILLSHSLLGEFLNPAELRLTIVALALVGDQFDDLLAERFGGTVFDAESNLLPGV